MSESRIRRLAHRLWERAGKPDNIDSTFFWAVAETILRLKEQFEDERSRGFLKGLGVLP